MARYIDADALMEYVQRLIKVWSIPMIVVEKESGKAVSRERMWGNENNL